MIDTAIPAIANARIGATCRIRRQFVSLNKLPHGTPLRSFNLLLSSEVAALQINQMDAGDVSKM